MTRRLPKIIPTKYRGVTYRSRTEARYAVLLTQMAVEFDYEAETYSLGGVWYLPDFFVLAWNLFIEVKGTAPTPFERERCRLLSNETGKPVLLVIGAPGERDGEIFFPPIDGHPQIDGQVLAAFAKCRACDGNVIDYWTADETAWGALLIGPHADWFRCGERIGGDRNSIPVQTARDERFGVFPVGGGQ